MTAPSSIDPARFLDEQLAQASPDLLRQMLTTFINTLMSAEADAVCGAEYGARSAERTNIRNGYRSREFDTRAGTLEVAIPKLRSGSYFPDWLLERRRRAERALTTVVATCYLLGVSTRRMEKLVESLGITRLSKSQVSEMAKDLDAQVADFRHRPLDQGPYTFLAADALVLKVREGGRVVGVHALVATGVNADGHREILGLQVTSAEDGAGWLAFFRDLTARGLTGVALVTSDAHAGLVAAIGATLPGASWQRCRTHYAANLMAATPKASWPWVRALLHSVYDQPDAASVHAQFDRVLDALGDKLPKVAEHLEGARADVLAFTALPLPKHIDLAPILDVLAPVKDVDGLTDANRMANMIGAPGIYPATPLACLALMDHYGIDVRGREIVLIGCGQTVGNPLFHGLIRRGATVTVCTDQTLDIKSHLQRVSLAIVAVGRAGLIQPAMVHEDLVLVDVGMSQQADGRIVGDVHPDVVQWVKAMTPSPGGVGAVTTMQLFSNLLHAVSLQTMQNGLRTEPLVRRG